MSTYSFAVLTDLREKPMFRSSTGRDFTARFDLVDGTVARICVNDTGYVDGPYLLRVVNDEQEVLGEASIVPDTSQVFRSLSLLVHFHTNASAENAGLDGL